MQSTDSAARPYIIIVEDEDDLSQMLRLYFESQGYGVETFSDGAQALRAVMNSDIDAVICDMVMPKMAGDMFYLAVQKLKPDLCERFVFVTGHGTSPGVNDFLGSVSQWVISKPFNVEDLGEAVRQALNRRRKGRPERRGAEIADEKASAGESGSEAPSGGL
jgi:DNA-binding NtrC family response regulator